MKKFIAFLLLFVVVAMVAIQAVNYHLTMLKDFPPIQITGNLDSAAKTITMKIKGNFVL